MAKRTFLFKQFIPIALLALLVLSACGTKYMFRDSYPEERWGKMGSSAEQTKKVLVICGDKYPDRVVCMLRKGFRYLDPEGFCSNPKYPHKDDLECRSLSDPGLAQYDWICRYDERSICHPVMSSSPSPASSTTTPPSPTQPTAAPMK